MPCRADLDAEGQRIYDRLADPGGGTLRKAARPRRHSTAQGPELGAALAPSVNHYLRHEAGLGGRVRDQRFRDRESNSDFEWAAHEPAARAEGVAPEIIDLIRWRGPTAALGVEADAVVVDLAREIFAARDVSPRTYARALAQFGPRQLVDLVALMGNYVATAATPDRLRRCTPTTTRRPRCRVSSSPEAERRRSETDLNGATK